MKCADRVWIVLGFLFCSLGSAGGSLRLAEDNIDEIVRQMSPREKAMLLVGCESLVSKDSLTVYVPGAAGYTKSFPQYGIPSTVMADGPVGVRIFPIKVDGKRHYCTCFPSSTLLASTWDTQLVETHAGAMGEEAAVYDVDVILTPGINIMRNPLCGRNFEYFSEDPVLSGLMGAAMVNGVQSRGIGTSLKHFVANNQQVNKLNNDSRIPVKALREIYLKGFEICLQHSNPWTVMSSYNKIGGILTQSNAELLRTVLREEWGYDGLVVSDWYGKRNSPEQLEGGTNLLMPGEKAQLEEIEAGIESGALSMEVIDDAVKHILDYVVKTKAFRKDIHAALPDLEQHAALSRSVAGQGMVLLKNDSCVLPLKGIKNISLFGATAYHSIAGGGGSSNVNKSHIVDISTGLEQVGFVLDRSLKDLYTKYNAYQEALLVDPKATDWERLSYRRYVYPEMDLMPNKTLVGEQAKSNDMAVVVIGRGSTEESDRKVHDDFNLSDSEIYMIDKVCEEFHARNKKVVVLLNIGGVVETASWKNKPDAILSVWFPGQECGHAVADVLTGTVNPSGKLPMTFPVRYSDIPSSKNYPTVGETLSGENFDYTSYEEGVWVGYRYFTTADKAVSYPFGYGLSYTEFLYSEPSVKKEKGRWVAKIKVTNVGAAEGHESVQVYVGAENRASENPLRELKAFGKTKLLKPGESEILTMNFTDYDLAHFDEPSSSWVLEKGLYKVSFGASCEDIRSVRDIKVKKQQRWGVNRVLNPVVPVQTMTID